MFDNIEQYEHHGAIVSVRSTLKGQHKSYCLCYACDLFKPNTPENCSIAERVFNVCVEEDLVLPVWECPRFEAADA